LKEKEKKGALVIGGGVAGIQAALDLADADFQVYLVERSSTLGGRMAKEKRGTLKSRSEEAPDS